MKLLKLLLVILGACCFQFNSYAWIKVVKMNGGFRGYKYVNEDHSGGNHLLACAEPGKTKCKWDRHPSFSGSDSPSFEDMGAIERRITELIYSDNLIGDFWYYSIFVEYEYDVSTDTLTFTLYSQDEVDQ
ncbi:MAG: hypothetical protein JJT77_13990 [Crocinitomicaceae bacterium]|nr:hypothetical protein [Crocinitomicaceae bacterium]